MKKILWPAVILSMISLTVFQESTSGPSENNKEEQATNPLISELEKACDTGNLLSVQRLVRDAEKEGQNKQLFEFSHGQSHEDLLSIAIRAKREKIVKRLIAAADKADMLQTALKNSYDFFLKRGDCEAIKRLFDEVQVYDRDLLREFIVPADGKTNLLLEAQSNYLRHDIAVLLLERVKQIAQDSFSNFLCTTDPDGESALIKACETGNVPLVKLLLDEATKVGESGFLQKFINIKRRDETALNVAENTAKIRDEEAQKTINEETREALMREKRKYEEIVKIFQNLPKEKRKNIEPKPDLAEEIQKIEDKTTPPNDKEKQEAKQ